MTDPDHSYDVEFTKSARKTLLGLDRTAQRRIVAAVALLRDNPRPPTMKSLVGRPGEFRIRVGDYRVIYEVHDDRLVVLVLMMGHRRDVYR